MEYIPAKSIVYKTKNTAWFGTDYNMNIYKGCCHGCIYCDSRSTCYGVADFDRVRAKAGALEIIRDDLRRKVRTGVVATGSMSDPYNPFEKELLLTRHALELVSAYGFGIAIATKSDLLLRDIDVLQEIGRQSPVLCKITITTADDALSARLEPGAPPSSRRFEALRQLGKAGVFAGILLMPVLPFLEDTTENILSIVDRGAASGVRFIYPGFGVTLRDNQREWYLQKLEQLFPGQGYRARYEKQYGLRYQCTMSQVSSLWAAFRQRCDAYGILYNMQDIVRAYKSSYTPQQLSLL